MQSLRFWLGFELALAAWAAWALEMQTPDSIRQAIAAQLESIVRHEHQNFDVEVAPLDPRLRLPQCDRPLEVSPWHATAPLGQVTVEVACRGTHAWTIYTKATVRVFQPAAVLIRALPKGTVLDRSMVALESVDVAKLRQGYFPSLEEVLGQRLRFSLPEGSVLMPQHLAAVKAIAKGDAVVIRAVRGGLEVRMGGHALMDGSLGQKIQVRNDRSQRVVEGIVHGPGEILVAF